MNKKILLSILIVALVIGLVFFIKINQKNNESNNSTGTPNLMANGSSANLESLNPNQNPEDADDNDESDEDDIVVKNNTPEPIVNNTPVAPVPTGITLSVLATHDSESDCWVGYSGKVYDVTSYLPMHPGGVNRISTHCGTLDGFTNAFEGQHGTSKVSLLRNVAVLKGDLA